MVELLSTAMVNQPPPELNLSCAAPTVVVAGRTPVWVAVADGEVWTSEAIGEGIADTKGGWFAAGVGWPCRAVDAAGACDRGGEGHPVRGHVAGECRLVLAQVIVRSVRH